MRWPTATGRSRAPRCGCSCSTNLEIWSPGRLPPTVTLERLGYDQFSRNRLIARVLVERGYIEEVGLGIRSIAPREGVVPAADPLRALLERGEINDRQYRGLLHAREHGTVARRGYTALTGVSERTALNDLTDLVRKGVLEPTGGRGWRAAYRLRDETG